MLKPILELIIAGAGIFSDERKLYYIKKAETQMKKIEKIEDTDFYNKDMNAKALAEREIERDTTKLRLEYIAEAKKWKI